MVRAGAQSPHPNPLPEGEGVNRGELMASSHSSRGRGTGFAGPQAPGCETQPFCVPSKPALQARSRGTQPPRGAGRYTK